MTASTSDQVLERLNRLHPKLIDLGLERVWDLLARLGDPQDKLAPVVHVAGTNGKGSTIAFLRACLEAAGRRVQVYTSPHLVRFHERVRLVDGLIDEADLVALLEHCEVVNEGRSITYFEITTVAALHAFAAQQADALLLETGLGGRLDATNVIARPRLTVLTPIDHDHAAFLGDRIADIAFEKAGILKPGVPSVVGPQSAEALAVIEDRAAVVGSPLLRCGQEWTYAWHKDGLEVTLADKTWQLPAPVLLGPHQMTNAATAVAAAASLGSLAPDGESLARGLKTAEWPGRLQHLTEGPLAGTLAKAARGRGFWELWVDGGHNPSAGKVIAEVLETWRDKPLHLVCGMMNSKEAGGFLAHLAPLAASCRCLAIPGEANAFDAETLSSLAGEAGLKAHPAPDLPTALAAILRNEAPGRVLICGSLYMAGRVLDHDRWRGIADE